MESGRAGTLAFRGVDISILITTTKSMFLVLDDITSNRRCFPFCKHNQTVLKIGFTLMIINFSPLSSLVNIRSSIYYLNISKERVR